MPQINVALIRSPQSAATQVVNTELEAELGTVMLTCGQQAEPRLLIKALQLWAMLQVRFGVCLIGPAGAGKSTVWRTLQVRCHSLLL